MMVELKNIPLIVIGGPTGVGKTDLSIHLAQSINGEIINGDSLQVYRGLSIGTGKILPEEMKGIPHHLLDIIEPDQQIDALCYKKLANKTILEIYSRGKIPIIVGGTGLYLEGLLFDLEFGGIEAIPNEKRVLFKGQYEDWDSVKLWERLMLLDPRAAVKIPNNNRRRILRALEVIELTGKAFSDQEGHRLQEKVYQSLLIVLDRPREELYERINRRVDKMIEDGLENEARTLFDRYQGELVAGAKGIGYKEWWPYFQGRQSFQDTIEAIKQNSRRYAKRQLTWFRNRFEEKMWLDANLVTDKVVLNIIESLGR